MKKRKIIVLSATALLAIVAFPALSAAVTGGPATRDSFSQAMGDSGCQMNFLFAQSAENPTSFVGPAFVSPDLCIIIGFGGETDNTILYACPDCAPPNPYCALLNVGGELQDYQWFCPDLDTNPPPGDDSCPGATWLCTLGEDPLNGASCAWWPPSGTNPCTIDFHTPPTSCPPPIIPPPPGTVGAPACTDIPVVDGLVEDSFVYKDCVRNIPTGGTWDGISWNCSGNGEQRLSVEKEIFEDLDGSCTYRLSLPGGKTKTTTLQCTVAGTTGANGCTCGVSSGCPHGAPKLGGGVCP